MPVYAVAARARDAQTLRAAGYGDRPDQTSQRVLVASRLLLVVRGDRLDGSQPGASSWGGSKRERQGRPACGDKQGSNLASRRSRFWSLRGTLRHGEPDVVEIVPTEQPGRMAETL
jgi:hypothetical protein